MVAADGPVWSVKLKVSATTVRVGRRLVRAILAQLASDRCRRIEVPFVDHRAAATRKGRQANPAEALRFHRDTRVARLLGNLASLYRNPMNDFREGKVRCVALGPRQATG